MEIYIRSANIEDSRYITELSDQLGYKAENLQTENRLHEILQLNDHCVFVAEADKKIVGWIHGFYSLRIESDAFFEIAGLVVDGNFRKKGVGKLLVEKIENWAQSINCNQLRVRCNVLRKESHVFYNKIGFSEIKQQKVFERNFRKSKL